MSKNFYQQINNCLNELKINNLLKKESIIITPQNVNIEIVGGYRVINFCSNNYLGLANDQNLILEVKKGIDDYGFGIASVRFICGTQKIHKILEKKIANFLCMEDAILYSSCFDANCGLFEPLFGLEDSIISDSLNHASIIDGIRLCKAKVYIFNSNSMDDLKKRLNEAKISGSRNIIIAVDGVTSMDGIIAKLHDICELANEYQALVIVDDSHGVGILGENGKGSHEYCNVIGKIDIITGTFGKALGGVSGGYIAAKKNVIELLRQKSRPYLFSNSLAPCNVVAFIKAVDMMVDCNHLREKLWNNVKLFREKMVSIGFKISNSNHAIIPIMLNDVKISQKFTYELFKKGIYVMSFFYPVVPKNKPRIRVQISASHSENDILYAVESFASIGKKLNIIK
ncbi:glycine C-acetyltransferase [Candidatus Providencia siddallii]|uniref:2-amino-3-ketobutyrate coenzyme A ligase n=1 Tax=Candidatus Providencia siddallii TaxID=1715285 RepID=A0ABM9NNE6_9GAMM